MRIVTLKPSQQVRVFGWINVRPYMQWQDVKVSLDITFRFLRNIGLTSAQLHCLQPDGLAWREHGGITIDDCHEMVLWPVHPCHDLGVSLDVLMVKQWKPSQMVKLGLNLADLTSMGMSTDNMVVFGYPLSGWIEMGLDREYLDTMEDAQVRRVFGISRTQVLHALPLVPGTTTRGRVEYDLVRPTRQLG
jgi:hypothetical protein